MTTDEIRSIILAAGKGTRMKSGIPKVLHSIMGKTLLERVINATLKAEDIKQTYVIVGHEAQTVTDLVEKQYPLKNVMTVLQEPQLGTGDAVFKCYNHLGDFQGSVMVVCGDTPLIRTETIEKFLDSHRQSGAVLTVMTAVVANPINYGRIIRDDNGDVLRIVEEKDATPSQKAIKEINAGIYCFDWQKIAPVFAELTPNNVQGEIYLTDIIDWSVRQGYKTNAYVLEDNLEVFGINSQKQLARAAVLLKNRKLEELMSNGVTIVDPMMTWISPETEIGNDSMVYPNCYIDGENFLGERNTIGPNTIIKGNVETADNVKIFCSHVSDAVIAENVTIGPFAHIRDGVEIADKVRIGNFVEVKKSYIDNRSKVAHLSYIGDTKIGRDVNIGAGTITANYNSITQEKCKTIIADGASIGANSVLVAPVKIEKNAMIGALSVITEDVPENALAVTRSKLKVFNDWVKNKVKSLTK
ncbi:MAG: bifunctional UDP-N-acetylglucosamine diphosphorylase/glucosamine-1-phosphate N-acetyltransferase GlmU [Candidatus Gastranaerophilales bacterium]|nr:bifunctional UDP-N-acetylglucosamine diphosphorylase/glucosamine-1-phosphate N-acetyltransferase GlmU [Candidatus Gastranaerophilales bacterium]